MPYGKLPKDHPMRVFLRRRAERENIFKRVAGRGKAVLRKEVVESAGRSFSIRTAKIDPELLEYARTIFKPRKDGRPAEELPKVSIMKFSLKVAEKRLISQSKQALVRRRQEEYLKLHRSPR